MYHSTIRFSKISSNFLIFLLFSSFSFCPTLCIFLKLSLSTQLLHFYFLSFFKFPKYLLFLKFLNSSLQKLSFFVCFMGKIFSLSSLSISVIMTFCFLNLLLSTLPCFFSIYFFFVVFLSVFNLRGFFFLKCMMFFAYLLLLKIESTPQKTSSSYVGICSFTMELLGKNPVVLAPWVFSLGLVHIPRVVSSISCLL